MRKLLVISITLAALTVMLQAQGRGGRGGGQGDAPGRGDGREAGNRAGVLTDNGGIRYINPGSPTVPDAEINSRPIPRMADGHVDLTGPWVGGGSNGDIERDGGLKPGELPLQPWAKDLREKDLMMCRSCGNEERASEGYPPIQATRTQSDRRRTTGIVRERHR